MRSASISDSQVVEAPLDPFWPCLVWFLCNQPLGRLKSRVNEGDNWYRCWIEAWPPKCWIRYNLIYGLTLFLVLGGTWCSNPDSEVKQPRKLAACESRRLLPSEQRLRVLQWRRKIRVMDGDAGPHSPTTSVQTDWRIYYDILTGSFQVGKLKTRNCDRPMNSQQNYVIKDF